MGLRSYLFRSLKTSKIYSKLSSIKIKLIKGLESFSSKNENFDSIQVSNTDKEVDNEDLEDLVVETSINDKGFSGRLNLGNGGHYSDCYIDSKEEINIDNLDFNSEIKIQKDSLPNKSKVINILVENGSIVQKTYLTKDGDEIIKYFN